MSVGFERTVVANIARQRSDVRIMAAAFHKLGVSHHSYDENVIPDLYYIMAMEYIDNKETRQQITDLTAFIVKD